MSDIDRLREALDRIPPMTGKVVVRPLPQAEAQNEAQANALVEAMMTAWKKSMDEADRLRAEVERLRAIEAAARAYVDLTPDRVDYVPLLFAKLQAALAAKEED